ncbi:MAG: DUF3795 domain-containing protein [Syntrophobacteraceae bacterium]|nr:DUF3795 domain-containing protein [Syntrophobacteraceae bacterium]
MDCSELTSPCGLDCFNCPMYLAEDTPLGMAMRTAIAQKLGLPYDRTRCPGCRNGQGVRSYMGATEPCEIYKCTSLKKIDFCFECDGFPCDLLHPYADQASVRQHNMKLFNLCMIRRMGLDEWVAGKSKSVREMYFKGKLRVHFTKEKSAK